MKKAQEESQERVLYSQDLLLHFTAYLSAETRVTTLILINKFMARLFLQQKLEIITPGMKLKLPSNVTLTQDEIFKSLLTLVKIRYTYYSIATSVKPNFSKFYEKIYSIHSDPKTINFLLENTQDLLGWHYLVAGNLTSAKAIFTNNNSCLAHAGITRILLSNEHSHAVTTTENIKNLNQAIIHLLTSLKVSFMFHKICGNYDCLREKIISLLNTEKHLQASQIKLGISPKNEKVFKEKVIEIRKLKTSERPMDSFEIFLKNINFSDLIQKTYEHKHLTKFNEKNEEIKACFQTVSLR
jgi:hypothetical protein